MLCMNACACILTPFLQLRTSLLNLYYVWLFGQLCIQYRSWFCVLQTHSLVLSLTLAGCLLFSLTVSTYFDFLVSSRVYFPVISFFLISWLPFGTVDLILMGTFLWPQFQVVSLHSFSWFPEHPFFISSLHAFLHSEQFSFKTPLFVSLFALTHSVEHLCCV